MARITLNTDELITYSEAAKLAGLARPSLYNRIADGRLHPVRIGERENYLVRYEVEAMIAAEKAAAEQTPKPRA